MQYIRKQGHIILNSIQVDDLPEIGEVLKKNLDKFISFAANDCGYSGSEHDIMVKWVHPLFLTSKTACIKADNLNWRNAMESYFSC